MREAVMQTKNPQGENHAKHNNADDRGHIEIIISMQKLVTNATGLRQLSLVRSIHVHFTIQG
jgi:hypothetical protein